MTATVLERIEGQAERLEKARRLVEAGKLRPLTPDGTTWAVYSETNPKLRYRVTAEGCSCPDYRYRHDELEICKHMLAVELALAERKAQSACRRSHRGSERSRS